MTAASTDSSSASHEMLELRIYRWSPFGPVVTTLIIGLVVYGCFFLSLTPFYDLPTFLSDSGGVSLARIAFILTLILCAALGVGKFDDTTNAHDAIELEREFGLHIPKKRETSRGLFRATLAGFIFGMAFLVFLIYINTGWNVLGFMTTGLWFVPMTPVLWMLMARGVYGSISAGQHMSRLIRDQLVIDLYRHHELALFGRIAMRGAFIWLIFVGIILLSMSDQGASAFAVPTLAISIFFASYNFVNTMQPIRKKIRAAKEAELKLVRARLAAARRRLEGGEVGAEIPALIALEERIEKIREWPLDLPTAARLPLYLVVPVVPWIAGVYAETVLEKFFGG